MTLFSFCTMWVYHFAIVDAQLPSSHFTCQLSYSNMYNYYYYYFFTFYTSNTAIIVDSNHALPQSPILKTGLAI